jgi:hypothetical protein
LPTLVLRGTGDNAIARERSTLEAPDAVTDALEGFLSRVG